MDPLKKISDICKIDKITKTSLGISFKYLTWASFKITFNMTPACVI